MAAPPRRPRPWLRSLSSRLVAGIVALVLILVAIIGGATFYFLHSFLSQRLNQQVASSAQQNVSFVRQCIDALSGGTGAMPPQCRSGFPSTSEEYLYVLPIDGVQLTLNGNGVTPLVLSADQQRSFASTPGRVTVLRQNGKELHVTAYSAPMRDGSTLTVVTGLATDDIDSTLHRLVVLEVMIGATAVLVAVLATSFGVQRGLRNLYRVTGTAREVTAELSPEGAGLDRRVPVVEEGTEVGQLAESMNTLLSAVETQFKARVESEQRMRQFLADASHELRTPLTSIRGYAELARMQRAAGDDAADNLHRIESEGTRMSRLVEDLMMLARTDSAENARAVEREPVEIVGLLDDVASATHAAFPERRIEVSPLPVPIVVGDRDQLLRVVRNLVTNACVHTRPEAPVMLRCYPNAGGAEIQVIDGGPGLPPEDAAHVFERFWRADKARTRARGGSGLGLSIVDTIIRAHGGAVRFDSSVETGSTVTVWLPPAGQEAFVAEPDLSEADVLASD